VGQGVRAVQAGDYIFFFENETEIIHWEQDLLKPQNGISSKERRVSDTISYINLRIRWCNITVMNVHSLPVTG